MKEVVGDPLHRVQFAVPEPQGVALEIRLLLSLLDDVAFVVDVRLVCDRRNREEEDDVQDDQSERGVRPVVDRGVRTRGNHDHG